MSKRKVKINPIDVILIFFIVVICLFAIMRNENVKDFNNFNKIQDTIITLSVKGIEKGNFSLFTTNDTVTVDYDDDSLILGKIIEIRSTPAVVVTENVDNLELTSEFSKIDIILEIESECLLDENGFFSINGKYISAADSFPAENSKIKFDCEVVSVKRANK